MMGQELFEHPRRQYREYGIEVIDGAAQLLSAPEDYESGNASEESLDALEAILKRYPDLAVTFDEAAGEWIAGTEDSVERMFADREKFIAALEAGEDPGL
ncbi:molecular chaperone GrpE [Corynebacterium lizhenjunii]|uniref:Molecular chaperone GrpE n=1 Tax=Corynebacterium lizhenjunii TaxID=2709394 RepID=A0A7T0PBA9_9CORY|nr:molecular chaperone GrpE [Corynebacterium lizhenjunii]QPK79966.1 molecular chaperone GrpE [Corynebacterium lizhenjunii]